MSGSKPAKRWASIDLPDPGAPIIKILWPPAAAISSARRAAAWPLTSAMSAYVVCGLRSALCTRDQPSSTSTATSPGKNCRTTSIRCCAEKISAPGTSPASCALASDKNQLGHVWIGLQSDALADCQTHGQRTTYRTQIATKQQLTCKFKALHFCSIDLPTSCQNTERNWQIKTARICR